MDTRALDCHPFSTGRIIGKEVPKMQFTNLPIVGFQCLPSRAFCLRVLGDDLYLPGHEGSPFVVRRFPDPLDLMSLLLERRFRLLRCAQHDALVESGNFECENDNQLSPGLSSLKLWPGS